MAIYDDLLEQARFLANREPKHPHQASLRRAVSSAYYALFHALIAEASAVLAPPQPTGLRPRVGRAFVHADMKKACAAFGQGNVASLSAAKSALVVPPIKQELVLVSRAFVELQEARHEADYDTLVSFSKADVVTKIQTVERSFVALTSVRGGPNTNVFFAALVLQEKWKRR